MAPVEPTASPLPPLPDTDPLSEGQWSVLLALADAIIPCIQPPSSKRSLKTLRLPEKQYSLVVNSLERTAQDEDHEILAKEYFAEKPSDIPAFKECFHRTLALYVPWDVKLQISLVFTALNTRAGALVLTGYPTPITSQPIDVRIAIVKSWATATIPNLRQLWRSLTVLCKQNWAKVSPTLPRVLGFPRVPVHGESRKGHDFRFIQIPPGDNPEVLETDVVIIGSGCGAGVCAKNLAEAGKRVLVVERAYHWSAEHFPMKEMDGWAHIFMHGGTVLSDDTNLCVIAGQAFGGGGTVNWSASLQTQGFVRREWADQGLPFFTSGEFQKSLDRVCDRMGVSADHIEHNKQNRVLLDGARKLGWAAKPVPQNTGGQTHYCGYCTMGCSSCEKQGPMVSFLPDAARSGATFLEGFEAEKVLFKEMNGKKIATGIQGIWTSRDSNYGVAGKDRTKRRVIIKASRVLVSAGTMQSPLVLLRSGLRNPHIGRHFKCHPVSFLGAVYEEEVKPWEGGVLTAVCSEFENQDGKGHGAKLEATTMLPTAWLSFLTWTGGLEFKQLAPKMRHMVGYISLARDKGEGQIYPDRSDGGLRVSYDVSSLDRKHIVEGLVGLVKINYVAGAKEIFTMVPGMPNFVRKAPATSEELDDGINDKEFQDWLALIRKMGLRSPEIQFMSAHQMGSCRMGATAKKGVVDPEGRVWGTEGLYVTDASVFPSASGVNPMITIMGISDWISRTMLRKWNRVDGARL